ncbi:glycerophosphodiester phosphodiesterase [Cytophaga sp. FL35]|nr:glycerophosphodiester phosphodiesterase [Cytophaga sp. FL35]
MKGRCPFIILFLTLTFSSCMSVNKPIVIGHRGAMGHETENTLASIQKAIELKVDMIEIDVFKIRTGEIVVFHDDEVDRLTNGSGFIEDYSFDQLRALVVEGGHKVPTLQEVLDEMAAKVDLNIELKGADTAEEVNRIVKENIQNGPWKLNNFIISSFKWDELKDMRASNTEIPIAILTGKDPKDAIEIAKELNAEAVNPHFEQLNAENNVALKEAGLKIYPWTVNDEQDIIGMKRLGVDGIITNYPERVK